MIPMDRVKACANPDCRQVLPADRCNPEAAGFYVDGRRPDGTAAGFKSRCKECSRRARRKGPSLLLSRVYTAVVGGVERQVKLCVGCGEVKIAEDRPDSGFYVTGRSSGRVTFYRLCKSCTNRDRAERRRADPAVAQREREWRRVWEQRNPERNREIRREWHDRYRREHREEYLERQRMAYHLRRQRAGLPSRAGGQRVTDGTRPERPAGPFVAWLAAYERASGLSIPELASALGLVERRLRGLLAGENQNVSVDVVSRALTDASMVVAVDGRTVVPFDDLYPEGELREKRRRR